MSVTETIWNLLVAGYDFIMDNLLIINILLSLVIVFFQRRSPQTVWTWLLLLYFIPILGFLLYLVIGQDFHKSRMFKAKEIEAVFQDEMLLMCPENERMLDQALQRMRKEKVQVPLKAVLTEMNKNWTSVALHDEIMREHEKMTGGK